VSIDLDARDSVPLERHELIDRNVSPLVEGKARDVGESDTRLRVVLADVPGAASRDVEELCDEARIFFAVLGAEPIAFGELFEGFEKLCLSHRKKG